MKTLLKNIFLALTALSALIGYGQDAAKNAKTSPDKALTANNVATASSQAGSGARSLLWKISGNGLSAPSYLYGTIHVTCDATLDKPTIDALNNTAQLYLELDLDDPSMQMQMMQGMIMSGGKTMESMISKADYELLNQYLKSNLRIDAKSVNAMKPMAISTVMLPMLLDCPMQSVEQELMKTNAGNNKETFGLEEIKDQIAIFDAIPYQVQMDELMKAVKNGFGDSKKELAQMYALYQSKDIDAMQKMTEESDNKLTADYQDVLLNDRNQKWIPKIESIAKSKPTFFGVGAAHLGGPNGVIVLLRKKGYTVEPVL